MLLLAKRHINGIVSQDLGEPYMIPVDIPEVYSVANVTGLKFQCRLIYFSKKKFKTTFLLYQLLGNGRILQYDIWLSISVWEGIFWIYFAGLGICSFQKNGTIFAFFSILYKRTERSLHSFPFFIKEQNDLCILFRSL